MKFTKEMSALIAECKASGLTIDDFLKKKLGEARADGTQYASNMLHTFAQIDANYASLTQAKARGQNRQEWLREKIEETIVDAGADRKRDMVGNVLSQSIDAINGDVLGTTSAVPFDGMDAVETVAAIDAAVANGALSALSAEQELKQ